MGRPYKAHSGLPWPATLKGIIKIPQKDYFCNYLFCEPENRKPNLNEILIRVCLYIGSVENRKGVDFSLVENYTALSLSKYTAIGERGI